MQNLKRKAQDYGNYSLTLPFSLYTFSLFLCVILWFFGPSAVNAQDIPAPQKIFLDPGHGGNDYGAKGSTNLIEKVVTLDVAKYLKDILQRRLGIEVFLTRSGDYYLSSAERIALANNRKADLFISLHTGAHFNPHRQGFNIFYLKSEGIDIEPPEQDPTNGMLSWLRGQEDFIGPSQQLAQIMMKNLNKAFYLPAYGGRVSGGPWAILIGARMPAVLIEIGHLTNPTEENRLKDKIYRQAIAEAISDGIEEYFSRNESN
jgi:N-acetylmuramoyl-L-alanine amidase